MLVLKVKRPLLRTSVSVLAVMLMTSGAVAEDELTAGTEPGQDVISVDGDSGPDVGTDPIYEIDPLPPVDPGEDPGEDIAVGEPDPGEDPLPGDPDPGDGADGGNPGGDIVIYDEVILIEGDIGSEDPLTLEDVPGVEVTLDGDPASDCGGCEYQSFGAPEAPAVQRGEVSQKARRSTVGSTAVKNSCLDPERYVPWLCDWQKDLGLIGQ